MAFIQVTAWGTNIKSLVTNDETEFKILNFRTYQKIVQLTVSRLETVRKIPILGRNLNGVPTTGVYTSQEEAVRLGQGKLELASFRFGKLQLNF